MERLAFSDWTIVESQGRYSLCRCTCGTQRHVVTADVKSGRSKGCGCMRRVAFAAAAKQANITHGMEGTPTYRTWIDMKRRCTQPHRPDFKNYGGRGITVCAAWLESFEAFLADMGVRPTGHTLDRLNNAKGYSKDNCVWAARKPQERNKRTNRLVEIDGRRMTFAEAAERHGINYYTAYNRFRNLGWEIDRVFKVPIRSSGSGKS